MSWSQRHSLRRRYFTSEPKQNRGRDSSIVPPLLPDKKQPQDELHLLQPLKSVSLWLPLFTRFREKLCTGFISSISRVKMSVRKRQSHRQAVKSSRPPASDLASSDSSVSPPSVGNAAAEGEKTSQGCRVDQTKRPLSACSLRARSEPWWPTLCSVWGSHCYRDEARAKSPAEVLHTFCSRVNLIIWFSSQWRENRIWRTFFLPWDDLT